MAQVSVLAVRLVENNGWRGYMFARIEQNTIRFEPTSWRTEQGERETFNRYYWLRMPQFGSKDRNILNVSSY